MKSTKTLFIVVVIGLIGLAAYGIVQRNAYNPVIVPGEFSSKISNPYFTMKPGKKLRYTSRTKDGVEREEIVITGKTKVVMGVETAVYWDRAWLGGELLEDTHDYIAQAKNGDIWYFGEDVNNYQNGKLKDHDGSWLAGVNGAKPGIWVKAAPRVGETYRQEYLAGEAEDMVDVLSVTETVTVRGKTYKNCLKTYDYSPLEPQAREHKYYCPSVRTLVMAVDLEDGKKEELVIEP